MGNILGDIVGGTPPYSIVVRKVGETTGNRCMGSCNSLPVEFSTDNGDNSYYFTIVDSANCTLDSRVIGGGVSNVNCDVVQPTYDAIIIQPICNEDQTYTNGILRLTNITNGARYKICYNTTEFNCAACTASDGSISGGNIDITLTTPNTPTTTGVLIRVYEDSSCISYKDYYDVMITPNCESLPTPSFAAALVQPRCTTSDIFQNAVLNLSNIQNIHSYKICYNTEVFTSACNINCTSRDGLITNTTASINITSPSQGVTQSGVIRFYPTTSCNGYIDYVFKISSPRCDDFTVAFIDFILFTNANTSECEQPSTYDTTFDMYATTNSVGLESINGQQAVVGTTMQRNLPNGNDTPNVYITASFKPSCGTIITPGSPISSIFYRFGINLSNLRANFPAVNEFKFDFYGNRTKGTGTNFNITRSAFKGIAMVKLLHSNNSVDGYRDPSNKPASLSESSEHATYSGSGYKKLGTLLFNYTTNSFTWTPV